MLKLSIFTPERKVLEGRSVSSVTLPGTEGQIQILEGHAAMVGALETGVLQYQVEGQGEARAAISTGDSNGTRTNGVFPLTGPGIRRVLKKIPASE